ncbi:hypothetical protein D3C81_1189350 [compost metagenome]
MLRKYKWTWILLAICVILAGYLLVDTYSKPKIPVIRPVQDFSMENVDGKTVTLQHTNGKVRLFYFFFTNCKDVCPISTFKMSQIQNQLKKDGVFGKDVSFVSISFDPVRDTREQIKKFGDKFNADYSGWYFLRGDEKKTAEFAMDTFQFIINKDRDGNFAHSDLIALVDREGKYRKYYKSDVSALDIADEVERLAKE